MPYAPWGQHLNYLWNMKATLAWEKHHREGKTDAVTGRFFGTKPMEELYDTSKDPDNVNNLIDQPEYATVVADLSKALDKWQIKHYDSGLLPESEVVKMSEDAGITIFDMVRDPSHYDVKTLQAASSLARVIGPAVAGFLFAHAGRSAPYLFGAVVMLGVIALAIVLRRRLLENDSLPDQ